MSVLDSPALQSPAKVGLKRKLTGPPRLLLGKTKVKGHCENREESRVRRRRVVGDSNGAHGGPMSHCPYKGEEDGSLRAISEDPKEPQTTVERAVTEVEAEPEEGETEADKRGWKTQGTKAGWKERFCGCMRSGGRRSRKAPVEGGDRSRRGSRRNAQSSKSVSTGAKAGKGMFSARRGLGLRWLLTTPNFPPKAKGESPKQMSRSAPEGSPRPHSSFRSKFRNLLNRGAEKPSPFCQEWLIGTHDYVKEESIVLSNKHADNEVSLGGSPCAQVKDQSEGSNEVSRQCLETVTVSAEMVTAGFGDAERVRDISTGGAGGENATAKIRQREDECVSQGCVEEGLPPSDPSLRMADSSETDREGVALGDSGHADCAMGTLEYPSHTDHLDSPATDPQRDSAAATSAGAAVPEDGVMVDNRVEVASPLKTNRFDRLCSRETEDGVNNSAEAFSPENLHSQDEDRYADLAIEDWEMLLRQTARSVVQAAMKAAMDELEEELSRSVASIHQEAAEC